jgi:hypothetical protein
MYIHKTAVQDWFRPVQDRARTALGPGLRSWSGPVCIWSGSWLSQSWSWWILSKDRTRPDPQTLSTRPPTALPAAPLVFGMGMGTGRKSHTVSVPANTAGIRLRVHTVPVFSRVRTVHRISHNTVWVSVTRTHFCRSSHNDIFLSLHIFHILYIVHTILYILSIYTLFLYCCDNAAHQEVRCVVFCVEWILCAVFFVLRGFMVRCCYFLMYLLEVQTGACTCARFLHIILGSSEFAETRETFASPQPLGIEGFICLFLGFASAFLCCIVPKPQCSISTVRFRVLSLSLCVFSLRLRWDTCFGSLPYICWSST